MAGQLDEISRAIGALQADVRNIARSIDGDRETSNDRHRDNSERLDKIERKLNPLEETVKGIKPIVDRYQISRWKFAGALAVGGPIVGGIGLAIVHVLAKLFEWLMSSGR